MLFELSEVALYLIDDEWSQGGRKSSSRAAQPEVVAVLGSVLDPRWSPDHPGAVPTSRAIYHAAAYKHVPIVEDNPFEGIQNNTFGTLVVAEAAKRAGVESFVLISTDKAVRPTNVMGATKRLAELVLQALRAERATRTVFTMVRFGNVLDSSGSVVPLLPQADQAGGPVTVTHPEVIRYFMSIPEAAQLVHPGGRHGEGRRGVRARHGRAGEDRRSAARHDPPSGLEVRDEQQSRRRHRHRVHGLRPGEKLYEELLIGTGNQDAWDRASAYPSLRRTVSAGGRAQA